MNVIASILLRPNAKKDDGFGAQVNFAETNGTTGTAVSTLKFYGEFSLIAATHTVYAN